MEKTGFTKEQCISNICRFPINYRVDSTRKPIEIYNASKYSRYRQEISYEDIVDFVRENTSIIDDWITFSKDKRWTPAWSFSKNSVNAWSVIYIEHDGVEMCCLTFNNPVNACAFMILMEMEQFRGNRGQRLFSSSSLR